jgi:predicted ATPase/DNA-binding CsgD family transcriptional regulator
MLVHELNEREIEIIALLAEGLANKEIAERLFLAPNTVKWYIKQINSKLDTSNRDEIVQAAQNRKLLNREPEAKPQYERPKSNLPRQSSAFIGRDAELDELHSILEKPDLRLITILAQGGMGKTRLALEAAEQQLGRFKDGVYFLGLQALGSFDEQLVSVLRQFITMLREGYSLIQCFQYVAENAPEPTAEASRQLLSDLKAGMEFPAAIDAMKDRVRSNYFGRVVGAIQVQFREGGNLAERFDVLEAEFRKELGDLRWSNKREYAEQLIIPALADSVFFKFQADERSQKEQLLNFLANKEMLLLTDNWEHLLDGAPLLNEILQAAPNIKILATSREKLQLLGETVYVLRGMDFPTWESPEDALRYDAIQLLLQAAQQVKADWRVTDANLDFVSRVCRLTQGMPLGILLAVSWLDMLSIEEIAQEITISADFLEAQFANVSERQHSIRAIFNYAWNKLSDQEQDVFMKLSVFRGGFSREAAKEVAGARLQNLHRLMQKALVMRQGDERYDLHELLRQYAEEKLRQSSAERFVRDAHAAYYLNLSAEMNQYLQDSREKEGVETINQNFENIRSAWFFSLEHDAFERLAKACEPLAYVAECLYLLQQISDWFRAAIQKLEAQGEKDSLLLGHFLIFHSTCIMPMSASIEVQTLSQAQLERSLKIAEAHQASFELYHAKFAMSFILYNTHGKERSLAMMQEAHDIAKMMNSSYYLANSFAGLVSIAWRKHALEDVLNNTKKAYDLFKKINHPSGIAQQVLNFGRYYWHQHDLEKAEAYFREALAGFQSLDFVNFSLSTQLRLAILLYEQAQVDEAEKHYQELYDYSKYLNHETMLDELIYWTAIAKASKGFYREALDFIEQAIPIERQGTMYNILGMAGEIDLMRQCHLDRAKNERYEISKIPKFQIMELIHLLPILAEDLGRTQATAILSVALHHPHCPKVFSVHAYIQKCLKDYEAELGKEAFEQAWENGKSLDIVEVLEEILAFYRSQ